MWKGTEVRSGLLQEHNDYNCLETVIENFKLMRAMSYNSTPVAGLGFFFSFVKPDSRSVSTSRD